MIIYCRITYDTNSWTILIAQSSMFILRFLDLVVALLAEHEYGEYGQFFEIRSTYLRVSTNQLEFKDLSG